jgi:hypothetical protein
MAQARSRFVRELVTAGQDSDGKSVAQAMEDPFRRFGPEDKQCDGSGETSTRIDEEVSFRQELRREASQQWIDRASNECWAAPGG